jgi:hypothetical protein
MSETCEQWCIISLRLLTTRDERNQWHPFRLEPDCGRRQKSMLQSLVVMALDARTMSSLAPSAVYLGNWLELKEAGELRSCFLPSFSL